LEVLNYPHPSLRFKTHQLLRVDDHIRNVAAKMAETMVSEQGAGLSANQVGLPFSMVVVKIDKDNEAAFINPVIKPFGKIESKLEGCLSLLDCEPIRVKRHTKVRLTAWDLYGNNLDEVFTGPMARVLQHECDHLNAILISDKADATQARQIAPYLRECEAAWNKYPQLIHAEEFNSLLEAYCGVKVPVA